MLVYEYEVDLFPHSYIMHWESMIKYDIYHISLDKSIKQIHKSCMHKKNHKIVQFSDKLTSQKHSLRPKAALKGLWFN